MKSRLEDLIATAEKQLAAKSFDAANDTLRTALGEEGAAEAGVPALLEAAGRDRDAARGIVRQAATEPEPVLVPAPPRVKAAAPAPPEAPPPAAEPWKFRTIAPPAFELLEPDELNVPDLGRRRSLVPSPEPERLSIIDPYIPPEPPQFKRLALTAVIVGAVCMALLVTAYLFSAYK